MGAVLKRSKPPRALLFEFVDEPKAALELLKQRISLEHVPDAKPDFARSRCGPPR